jgi:hypothetical protein
MGSPREATGGNSGFALKGRGFSRAVSIAKSVAALAAEVRL